MGTNDIINSEVKKDLEADSIINIATECVSFDAKSVFISSLTVNTERNLAFISAVNNALKAYCFMYNFHFINNSSISRSISERTIKKQRKNCTNMAFFWFVFSRIWTEYEDLRSKSPYSVQIREHNDQKNSVFGHFSRSYANNFLKNLKDQGIVT